MHIVTREGTLRLQNIWREAGRLEIPGCVLFRAVNDMARKNSRRGRVYISTGETRQDIPRDSRTSVPFPCAESVTSIDFHTHPRDERNAAADDLVFLSPPSASDVSTRILLAATGENATAALVLAEEGIYVMRNTTQWSKRVTRRIAKLKQGNMALIDYTIFLMRQLATLSTLVGTTVDARAEAIARLPLRAARDAVVVEALPSIADLVASLRKTLEQSSTRKQYRAHAARYGIDISLHPYGKALEFALVKNVHKSRWADNPAMQKTLDELTAMSGAVFHSTLVVQAHLVGEKILAMLPAEARPSMRFQRDGAFATELAADPDNRALVYRGGTDLSLRLVGAETAPASAENVFCLLDHVDEDKEEQGRNTDSDNDNNNNGDLQDAFELRVAILRQKNSIERPPFPPLSAALLPHNKLAFLEIMPPSSNGRRRQGVLYANEKVVETAYNRIGPTSFTLPLMRY